jgi:hypothetical protein
MANFRFSSSAHLLLIVSLLLATAHRLPAPIREIEAPPPGPEPTARSTAPAAKATPAPVRKISQKPRTASTRSPSPAPSVTPARSISFGGIWSGMLHGAGEGKVISIVVTADETRTTIKGAGSIWGDRNGIAVRNGNTLAWTFLAETWKMVAAPDGKTAQLSATHWPSGSSFGTMSKVQ